MTSTPKVTVGLDKDKNRLVYSKFVSEEKHTFVYKKLVVPMSMRSIYWKCYGFPANEDGDILTKVKIVCLLCKTVIAYNRNTSNLRMHLQNKHPRELQELESTAPPRKPRPEIKEKKLQKRSSKHNSMNYMYTTDAEGAVQVDGNVQVISDPNISVEEYGTPQSYRVLMKDNEELDVNSQHVTYLMPEEETCNDTPLERNKISDAIVEFVILDLQLPDIVESSGFQRLVATLRSPCEIPSKLKLTDEIIPKIYDTYKDSLFENLAAVSGDISLGIEEWLSANSDSYVTFSAHFQQPGGDEQLQSKVLSTFQCSPLSNSDEWIHLVNNMLQEWGIKQESIKAVIVATDQLPLVSALGLHGYNLIPCLIHTLQEVCNKGCFLRGPITKVIIKVRSMLNLIFRNPNAQAALRIQENLLQLEDVSLTSDYPNAWISTYVMLEQLAARRTIMGNVIDNLELSDYQREIINMSDEEWSIVEDVVSVLEPFKVTTMTLAEEKTPLISLLRPLLWQLINFHLKVRDSDSSLAIELKLRLSGMLKERYSEESIDLILKAATTLDPRFKSFPYTVDEAKMMLNGPLKAALIQIMEEHGSATESNSTDEPVTPSKKPRLSDFLLGDLGSSSNSLSNQDRAELEIAQYQSESTVNLDECPLQWWQKAAFKLPNLSRLANGYNCVLATATPPVRIPVEAQVNFNMKRAKLGPHLIDKLLFLNSNYII